MGVEPGNPAPPPWVRALTVGGGQGMATKRRNRLIPHDGIECFEIRLVTSLTEDGELTLAEITTPTGEDYPSRSQMLGAMADAVLELVKLYDADDG